MYPRRRTPDGCLRYCPRAVPLPALLLSIITGVLAPILLMVGIGALIRYKFKLDLATLAELNL